MQRLDVVHLQRNMQTGHLQVLHLGTAGGLCMQLAAKAACCMTYRARGTTADVYTLRAPMIMQNWNVISSYKIRNVVAKPE